jgi:hypothetical protein
MTLNPDEQKHLDVKHTEQNKLVHDTLTQLVTISSASILIMVAFLEKLAIPIFKVLTGFSFAGFFACILLSLSLMKHISLNVTADPAKLPPKYELKYKLAKYSFLSSVGLLVLLLIINLVWPYILQLTQR